MDDNETITLTFTVDEYTGIAGMVLGCVPEGYRFVKVDRKGTKAVATYVKIAKPA